MKHVYLFNKTSRAAEYGIGTYIAQLSEMLLKLHYKVTVVKLLSVEKEFTVTYKDGIRYIDIPSPQYANQRLDMQAIDEKMALSIPVILYPFIDTNEENIFHFHFLMHGLLAAALRRYYRCFILLTVHYTEWSLNLSGNRAKLFRLIHKENVAKNTLPKVEHIDREGDFMNNVADRVIAISAHSYHDLVSIYKVDPEKVCLIGNGIKDKYRPLSDTKKQQLKDRFLIGKEGKTILYAGRIDKVKGVDYLVDAFKIVVEKYPDTRLFIAGDGPAHKELMERSRPVWSKISFTGFIRQKELYRLFSIADIGVLTSLHEEFGFVATEMMMHGLPMVVNDSTGLAELIDDRVDGLKFTIVQGEKHRKASVTELAGKIIQLIEDASLEKKMGYNARRKFLKKYELSRFQEKMKMLYESIP